ncbi:MAG: hypothetical protein GX591_20025 [Planctomycetes bacterium]|nr:hypothetical protein [Planctomycetota bacterium]
MILKTTACTLALLAAAATALAENVDLVTLPRRAAVQLTIYNSEDLTLVKETRLVTLKQGPNRLQFSWAGTLIDPTSVTFRAVDHADEVELADTVFPGQKPQHLIWNIESAYEGQVLVEVTYFTSGLTWSMDYVAIVDPAEQAMQFRGYVRVFNNSGEDYENAEVRLIVGTINLVEKIADLARRRGLRTEDLGRDETRRLNRAVMSEAIDRAGLAMDPPPPPPRACPPDPGPSSRRGSASTSCSPSRAPRPSPTAGASGCGPSRPTT